MNERSKLDKKTSSTAFRSYYYLKQELVDFCRKNGLSTSGGKAELTERIACFLDTGKAQKPSVGRMTADGRLWNCCKHQVKNDCVFFENIRLGDCHERAYTLYCAAKDLTLGTKHITVSDLADADLVPPMLFRTICNAMAIRRFGLIAIRENCHD